jgi:hypothetical protein
LEWPLCAQKRSFHNHAFRERPKTTCPNGAAAFKSAARVGESLSPWVRVLPVASITCSRSASVSTNCSEKLARRTGVDHEVDTAPLTVEVELPAIIEDGRRDGKDTTIRSRSGWAHDASYLRWL